MSGGGPMGPLSPLLDDDDVDSDEGDDVVESAGDDDVDSDADDVGNVDDTVESAPELSPVSVGTIDWSDEHAGATLAASSEITTRRILDVTTLAQ